MLRHCAKNTTRGLEASERSVQPGIATSNATHEMTRVFGKISVMACSAALIGVWCQASAQAQQNPPSAPIARPRVQAAPQTTITVDGSEAMFTTMCALLAAGFESDISAANWHPLRAQLRERMQHQQGPAVEAVREFYKKHQLADEGAMPSQYVWLGLGSRSAPQIAL